MLRLLAPLIASILALMPLQPNAEVSSLDQSSKNEGKGRNVPVAEALDTDAFANQCPAINCDCDAFATSEWVERCVAAEKLIKQTCVENNGVPLHYCGLHGPKAAPLAINTQFPSVPPTSEETLRLYKRQIVMIIWSMTGDLDHVQQREEQGNFGEAVQILRLLDRNIDRLFTIQVQAAEGERQRVGSREAEDLWQEYRDELAVFVQQFEKYGDLLWQKMEVANEKSVQKAYRVLAMKIYRTGSKLAEHIAIAEQSRNASRSAARAWQYAASLAQETLQKEIATTNSPKRVSYYRSISAARWNRASYYWGRAQMAERAAESATKAEALLDVK